MASSYANFAAPTTHEASRAMRSIRNTLVMQRLEREERARRRRNTAMLFATVLGPLAAWVMSVV